MNQTSAPLETEDTAFPADVRFLPEVRDLESAAQFCD